MSTVILKKHNPYGILCLFRYKDEFQDTHFYQMLADMNDDSYPIAVEFPDYCFYVYTYCLTVVVYLLPSHQGYSPCSAGPFEALLYLILFNLHFVLLVYSFLVHIIGFSKQKCFQSFPKSVNVFTVFNFHW